MKHTKIVTKSIPKKALSLPEGHPGLWESITGFFANPMEVFQQHLQKGSV